MMVSMVLSLLLNSSIETYTWVSTGLFRGSWYLGVWNHYDGGIWEYGTTMMVSMVLSILLHRSIETYTWVSTGLFRGSWYLGVWNHYDGINGSLSLVTQ